MKIKRIIILFMVAVLLLNVPVTVNGAESEETESVGSVTQSDNEKEIYDFLREELGLNTAAICGILANLYSESRFLPTAYNPNDSGSTQSYGICQWNSGASAGNRLGLLKEWCKANGYSYKSLEGQLQYMKHELLTVPYYKYSKLLNEIEDSAEGAYEASKLWSKYFEGCAMVYYESRASLAKDIFWPVYNENQEPTPIIAGAVAPDVMTEGDAFSLKGSIVAGINITKVTVGCYDVSGNRIIGKTVKPNARYYNIENLDSDLRFGSLTPGIYKYKVTVWTEEAKTILINEMFVVKAKDKTVENGTYQICSASNEKYSMGSKGDASVIGTNIQLVKKSNKSARTYYIEHIGSGYYMIKNVKNGCVLSLETEGENAGTNVVQNIYTSEDTQLWQILAVGNGGYYFVPKLNSNNCLTVENQDTLNLAVLPKEMSEIQIFSLENSKCDFTSGNKITFNAGKGKVGTEKAEYLINGYNTEREADELIVYNVSGLLVDTNKYGCEAAVDKTGKVTQIRTYGSSTKLTVPKGGMVISGHSQVDAGGGAFVAKLQVGDYIYCDYANDMIYAYSTYNDYLADSKTVKKGEVYGELPTPVRKNYLFLGWYTKSSGGVKVTSKTEYSVSTLYARWKYTNLSAPASVKLKLTGYNDVKVSWDEVEYADGYFVYYKRSDKDEYSAYKTTTSTSITISNLNKANTKYDFKVVPYYLNNSQKIEGKKYTEESIKTLRNLKKPDVLKLKSTGKTKIKASWSKVSYASGYYVYYKTSGGEYRLFSRTTDESIVITGLKKNTTYTIKVVPYGVRNGVRVKSDYYITKSIKTLK